MRRKQQRGSAIIEFSLAGIALIFLIICTFHVAMGMWNYHMLASTVHEATRYAAVKGEDCTKPGYTCKITVGDLATKIKSDGIGVPSDQVIVTLKTDSGAETSCNPLNSCLTDTTVWPPSSNSDNKVGKYITISAIYHFRSPLLFFWPGNTAQRFGEVWLPASSSQRIIF